VIDSIIFDAEGVVIDTEPLWDKAQEEFLARRGQRSDRARVKPLLTGQSLLDGTRILQAEYGLEGDPCVLSNERLALVRDQISQHVGFIPGFQQFFETIRSKYKTCLATAMPEELLALVCQRLPLASLFGDRIYSLRQVGGRGKPSPDLFLYAAAQLQSRPANCLVIEDAPHGIEAARRAGIRSVGLTTTYPAELLSQADVVVGTFSGIPWSRWSE
jgi:beta-phosphoglucomutase